MNDLTLMLNAAEQRVQFGLARGPELLCGQDWAASSHGMELLVPALAEAMGRLHLEPRQIVRIACVCGPGSFTGLRLALSTASALAHAHGAQLAGINYLELLANGVPCQPGQRVRVLTHARSRLVYSQYFVRTHEGSVCAVDTPQVLSLDAVVAGMAPHMQGQHDLPLLVVGSALARNMEALASCPGVQLLPGLADTPTWDAFVRVSAQADFQSQDIAPLYLRQSEAEDNLEALAVRRGDDPHLARATLQHLLTQSPESEL